MGGMGDRISSEAGAGGPDRTGVTVVAFGSAVSVLGWSRRTLEISTGARLAAVIEQLENECPRFVEGRGRVRYAVNEAYAGADTVLRAGDEVAIIPPVSGGGPEAPCARSAVARLTRETIDVRALECEVGAPAAGAVCTFVGLVRAERRADGLALEALEYGGHETMALREMQSMCDAALGGHAVHAVRLVHRLGRIAIGEASVAVLVSAPHRAAAFEACRALIESLKKDVPIFKREIWHGGAATWVDPI